MNVHCRKCHGVHPYDPIIYECPLQEMPWGTSVWSDPEVYTAVVIIYECLFQEMPWGTSGWYDPEVYTAAVTESVSFRTSTTSSPSRSSVRRKTCQQSASLLQSRSSSGFNMAFQKRDCYFCKVMNNCHHFCSEFIYMYDSTWNPISKNTKLQNIYVSCRYMYIGIKTGDNLKSL